MFRDLGVHWGSAIPGFIALACFPFPIFFYKYGERIRMKCKYSAEAARFLESLKGTHEKQNQSSLNTGEDGVLTPEKAVTGTKEHEV
jgi:hypothetical protein